MLETLQNYRKKICKRGGRKTTGEGGRRKNSSKKRKRSGRSIPEKKKWIPEMRREGEYLKNNTIGTQPSLLFFVLSIAVLSYNGRGELLQETIWQTKPKRLTESL